MAETRRCREARRGSVHESPTAARRGPTNDCLKRPTAGAETGTLSFRFYLVADVLSRHDLGLAVLGEQIVERLAD